MPTFVSCIVQNCKKRSDRDKEVKYFAIPAVKVTGPPYSRLRSVRRRLLWLARINKDGVTSDNVKSHWRVCGHHFVSGAPSKTSEEYKPNWAPSLNLGYDLPATFQGDDIASVKPEPGEYSETARKSNNSESSNHFSLGPAVTVKEECSSDHENCSSDVEESKVDTSVINTTNTIKQQPAIDFVQVSMIDSPEGQGEEFKFVNKEAELDEWKEKYADLVSQHTSLQKEHTDLQKEHAELKKYYNKLRDNLTDAEVDKLELQNELAKHIDNIEKITKENSDLQALSASNAEKVKSCESRVQQLESELRESEIERTDLKTKLYRALYCGLTLEQLKQDDLLIECYTGLPNYPALDSILSLVSPEITEISTGLAPWECLFLTLMRLKLSLKLQVLGDKFGVSVSTVQRIFERWLYALFKSLKTYIKYPESDIFLESTPSFFRKLFGDCSVLIVECVELFACKPGKHDGDYSSNKSVKFVIGFTSYGKVVFLSKEWDRKHSTMHITANSGLLEKLSVGDVILANQGFPTGEDDGLYCARVAQTDSSPCNVLFEQLRLSEKDKPSSFLRYVKSITNTVTNKFSFLQNGLPWEMFSTKLGHDVNQIEEVITVCCALINMTHN